MINFQLSPSTFIGIILLITGISLYFIRIWIPSISRDYDLIFSSMKLLCGGILIFQGWRLDPILLFSQILLSIIGIFFIWETLRLRKKDTNKHESIFSYFDKTKKDTQAFQTSNNQKLPFFFIEKELSYTQIVIKRIPPLYKKLKKNYYLYPKDFN
jgi:cytochrome b subunit of formate dehydrogenase